jgi:hypothetical protein
MIEDTASAFAAVMVFLVDEKPYHRAAPSVGRN